jgi:A/G-specific adenine glycosylase
MKVQGSENDLLTGIGDPLLSWFDRHARELPWRGERDPYRIWLSEVMLQQTQVSVVIPYYRKFVARYPRLEDLAAADETEVLEHWAGMGYYRRATSLLRAARKIQEEFGGVFPRSSKLLMELPGMGRYSAGAVASIAFGEACPVLDGNVRRVLARYLCLRHPKGDRELWGILSELVSRPEIARRVGDFNQALMELGAMICLPRRPRCRDCPVAAGCAARAAGIQDQLPQKSRRSRSAVEKFTVLVIQEQGRTLMRRRHEGPYLRGFWEPPMLSGFVEAAQVPALSAGDLGLEVEVLRELILIRHRITFRDLHYRPFACRLVGSPGPEDYQWVSPGEGHPVGAATRKLLDTIPRTTSRSS